MNSPTVFYIVLIIAVLNVLGYASMKEWDSLTFFLLATGVTYAVTQHRVLALVVGVVGASLFKASGVMHREGLEVKSKPKMKLKSKSAGAAPTISSFDNLALNIQDQEQLLKVSKQMGPLVQSMNKMISGLPEGFLEKAVESLKNKSHG